MAYTETRWPFSFQVYCKVTHTALSEQRSTEHIYIYVRASVTTNFLVVLANSL